MTGAADGQLEVLVVDDEEPALADLAYLLRQHPRIGSVVTASDATEALRRLRDGSFAAVFLDIRMPGLDGLELARVLSRFARPPEIVRAVFTYAARHPEILSHVPCFCGCEQRGHRNNDDCFVASRDARGRVTSWEPHGVG